MEKGTALPKNIRQIGDIGGKEKICIEDYVMTYIRKKESQEEKGYLGIFLGERKEEKDAVYVFIRGILEVTSAESETTEKETDAAQGAERAQEAKTEQELLRERLDRQRASYFPSWEIQGCCVIGAYPTKQLELLSGIMPEAGRLIYHLQEQEETLYWRENEQYSKMRGYFVFYEQNRKMQEYLGEVFKDSSVEKESIPDWAIRSFREKIKEKGEKKTGSILKLASSLFVVTVLVVGAIVVSRIDEIRSVRNQALSELEALSNQAQQEGERQSAVHYAAGDTQTANQTSQMSEASTENAQNAAGTGLLELPGTGTAETGIGTSDTPNAGLGGEAPGTSNAEAGITDRGTSDTGMSDPLNTETDADTGTSGTAMDVSTSELSDTAESGEASEDQEDAASQSTAESEASPASSRAIRASYVIKQGDTLASICSRYYGGLDRVEEICNVNNITDADMIMPGQKIVLP